MCRYVYRYIHSAYIDIHVDTDIEIDRLLDRVAYADMLCAGCLECSGHGGKQVSAN